MRLSKSNSSKSGRKFNWFSDNPSPPPPLPTPAPSADRRSIAVLPTAYEPASSGLPAAVADPNSGGATEDVVVGGIRSALTSPTGDAPTNPFAYPPTLARRITSYEPTSPPPPQQQQQQQQQQQRESFVADQAPMSSAQGKTSTDSGPQSALDRWSQRRLQRLNTEQGFREQRQGGQGGVFTPPPTSDASSFTSSGGGLYADAQPPSSAHYPSQPNPSSQQQSAPASNPGSRTALVAPLNYTTQSTGNASSARSASYQQHDSFHASSAAQQPPSHPAPHTLPPPQYSPNPNNSNSNSNNNNNAVAAAHALHLSHLHHPDPTARPTLSQSRSFSQQSGPDDVAAPMSNSGNSNNNNNNNNGNNTPSSSSKSHRSANANRQSMHNAMSREPSSISAQGGQAGVPLVNAPSAGTASSKVEIGRGTPQPLPTNSEEMTDEEVAQLMREHKELRDKYTKVKKYYFEKEDQVKQLQNSLAHQRLSQSRTSLDDSEYTTRFNRLDGLIAQLAFSIRKSWRTIPAWLQGSVNKDAVATGKQEMTAVGRAVISAWLVEEVFDKFFHPDLEPSLSAQLKSIQRNIRRSAPIAQSAEEEEVLTSKIVNWRLATLDGLQEVLRSAQCRTYRQQLTDMLNEHLVGALAVHLQDPPPSDLEGGVHMIVELVVSIAIHLPLESRDVQIDYFTPNYSIMLEQMKLESGIPALSVSVADEAAERASIKSATSDVTDATETTSVAEQPGKKRSMLSALTGGGGGNKSKNSSQAKHAPAGNSSNSLNRPESAQGHKDEGPPRVRMSAGIGVSVRGRSVLVKAPIFST